jgi:hypothetical protein
MKLAALAILAAASLGGCAQQNLDAASATATQQQTNCRLQYPGDKQITARMNCSSAAVRNRLVAANLDSDLIDVYFANWAQLAAQVDAGRMSMSDAGVAFARSKAELNQMQTDRRQQRAMTALSILSAMPAYQAPVSSFQSYRPYMMPTNAGVTCYGSSGFLHCN